MVIENVVMAKSRSPLSTDNPIPHSISCPLPLLNLYFRVHWPDLKSLSFLSLKPIRRFA